MPRFHNYIGQWLPLQESILQMIVEHHQEPNNFIVCQSENSEKGQI